ncbi:MAG: DUF4435 domain-containing protein [Bacteroidales bacterium]|jgi:hypothetical protein|nr:DUF4435 domain-containing protein [Bacteroidales bacterium]
MHIDELRKSRNKPQVAFQEFALSVGMHPNHLFCFFEGKDNPYYVPRIKSVTENYHPVICGNKAAVLGVYALIVDKQEYNKYKLGFFIDRDFNKSIGVKTPPIFETPCYSIENLYVSVDVFKEILINEFQLSEANDKLLFESLVELYEKRQKEFHDAVLLFNSWYACLIEKKEDENLGTIGINLDNKLPQDFIDISLQEITSNYDLNKIKEKFPNAIEIDESILNAKIDFFKSVEQHKVFRGKYEMEFLLQMIKKILLDSYTSHNKISKKISFSFGDGSSLSQKQLLNIFSACAETPQELIDYLRNFV